MRFTVVFACVLALSTQAVMAQEQPSQPERKISITGSASVMAEPDIATITLGVTRHADEAGQALAEMAQASRAVFERLEGFSIEPRDMMTRGINLRPIIDDRLNTGNEPAAILGYEASSTLTIRVRRLDDLGAILDQAARAGSNTFNGLYFSVTDIDELKERAHRAAVEDAMARAELLAKVAGASLGPVLSISDRGTSAMPLMSDMGMVRSAPAVMPVAGGEISVSASVSMVFALGE